MAPMKLNVKRHARLHQEMMAILKQIDVAQSKLFAEEVRSAEDEAHIVEASTMLKAAYEIVSRGTKDFYEAFKKD